MFFTLNLTVFIKLFNVKNVFFTDFLLFKILKLILFVINLTARLIGFFRFFLNKAFKSVALFILKKFVIFFVKSENFLRIFNFINSFLKFNIKFVAAR
jgi:hypothetical protein